MVQHVWYVRNVAVFVVVAAVVVICTCCVDDVLFAAAAAAVAPLLLATLLGFALLFGGGPKSVGDTLIARTSRFLAAPVVEAKPNKDKNGGDLVDLVELTI